MTGPDLYDDEVFGRAFAAEYKRAGARAVKTVWLFSGFAYKKINEVPIERRKELIDSLRFLPDLAQQKEAGRD